MPDGTGVTGVASATAPRRYRPRLLSPLLRRILLVNALPLALLVVALLYLNQYQNGLLEAQVGALREQARVFAGALAESAVSTVDPTNPKLVPEIARPLLRRLTDPTPDAEAKLYAPDGMLMADSRVARWTGWSLHRSPAANARPRPCCRHDRVALRQSAELASISDEPLAGRPRAGCRARVAARRQGRGPPG